MATNSLNNHVNNINMSKCSSIHVGSFHFKLCVRYQMNDLEGPNLENLEKQFNSMHNYISEKPPQKNEEQMILGWSLHPNS